MSTQTDEILSLESFSIEELEFFMSEGTYPADCKFGCYVEAGDTCEHGKQNILLKAGLV